MGELLWLHSGGSFNKEPENDLGNYPSRFEISGEPPDEPNIMNNLFDDVMPEEATDGMTDYRCFYFWNPNTKFAITDVELNLEQCEDCEGSSTIYYGSKLQNDIQSINITCAGFENIPDLNGYVIFDTEFGPPFTVYYLTNWGQFGVDLQARFSELFWGSEITVTPTGPGQFDVEFAGEVGNREVCLIRLVQNSLLIKGAARLHTVTYFANEPFNGFGDSIVRCVEPINNYVPPTGTLRIYNPLTGLWDVYTYSSYLDTDFFLDSNLQFNMVGFKGNSDVGSTGTLDDPNEIAVQNWQRHYPSPNYTDEDQVAQSLPITWGVIEVLLQDKTCQVCIEKKQVGHPINTIADEIETETDAPEGVTFNQDPILVGNLKPNEGFYWWIKREVPPGAPPCQQDYFSISVNATKVSWPIHSEG